MFYSLFPHLKTSDAELAFGCVNVFGGLQSLCSFVLENCKAHVLDCSIPLAQIAQVDPMEWM